ncbi:MAG: Xaa-Pro peptidase family protein [Desulfuromonadales bacterium]|nr:Xaa-Pro peptidase family protein [Desulfuromonadales bacterium]
MPESMTARRQKVTQLLAAHDLDVLVLHELNTIRYLCGFTGSDGLLVAGREQTVFLTDSRYTVQAGEQVCADRVEEYRVKIDGLLGLLREFGVRRIGFEADLAFGTVVKLQEKGGAGWDWRPLDDELAALRLCKDEAEIALMEQAAGLHVAAFAEVAELLRPGVEERAIALRLEFALKNAGAEEKSFDFIVASGVRGALPHGVASDRTLQDGELVTIDFGCRWQGYHSDETVTVAIGEPSGQLRRIHDIVREAHDRALVAVRPGIPLHELDRIAREYIAAAGYGEYFGHGLGHGIGLAVHEAPRLSPRSELVAAPGMVFTIEPGVYLPGVGGVRIEDMVLVTDSGARLLTQLPKECIDYTV